MRILIRGKVLLAGACMMAGLTAWGQAITQAKPPTPSTLDVAITYNTLRGNITTGNSFWMQGGGVQAHGQFWHGLGVVADISGLHVDNMSHSGVGLDMVTATFGPRYTWTRPRARYAVYAQALGGEAFGLNSTFPGPLYATSTTNSLAMQLGGGVNLGLTRHTSLRLFEADWLRTQMTNGTTYAQNNLRIGAGVIFRLP